MGVKVPENAELIRNLMIGAQYVHDHVMHFYHLHALDWVDVVSALGADAGATASLALSNNPDYYKGQTVASLTTVFNGVKAKLQNLLDRGQLGLFANGYWGHSEYKLPAAGNLLAVAHYLDALGWAREIVKLHTIFGGKDPHPNLVVGGVPCAVSSNYSSGSSDGGTSLNQANMAKVTAIIAKMKNFVDQVYVPDTILVAGFYKSQPATSKSPAYVGWEKRGGTGWNYLCYGEFPENGIRDLSNLLIPQGVLQGNLSITSLDMVRTDEIQEYVAHSWYSYLGVTNGNNAALHPSQGQTNLDYAARGAQVPGYKQDPGYTSLVGYDNATNTPGTPSKIQGYSWIKSPRWYKKPMEVGPLAHVVMMYAAASATLNPTTDAQKAHQRAKDLVDTVWVSKLGLAIKDIDSTLGRITARTIETSVIADAMNRWHTHLLSNIKAGNLATFITDVQVIAQNPKLKGFKWTDPSTWNISGPLSGVGFTEAPRGALGHWLTIDQGKIKNYQCIVASQWNAGPRDAAGNPGPYEMALLNHSLANTSQPLEILRTIHSFDPCIGCAVHVTGENGEELVKINVTTTLR